MATNNQVNRDALPDINRFLDDIGFGGHKDHFNVSGITTEFLLTFSERHLDELLLKLGINSVALKVKFKNKVKALKSQYRNETTQIHRVVMTAEEAESMDQLKAKLLEINAYLKYNEDNMSKMVINKQQQRQDINDKLDEESNEKINELEKQTEDLEKYKEMVQEAIVEQQGLSLIEQLDTKKNLSEIGKLDKSTKSDTNCVMTALYKLLPTAIWNQSIRFEPERGAQFEWNPSTKHEKIILSKNNKEVTTTGGGWYKCVAKNLLSSRIHKAVIWEVTITEREADNDWYFSIGYVKQREVPHIDYGTPIGAAWNECGLYLRKAYGFSMIDNFQDKFPWNENWRTKKIKRGDRLKLYFDYIERKCIIYYNDQEVGLLTNNLPDNIYPAVSLCHQNRVETTRFSYN